VASAEHYFKRRTRPPKDHFEKVHEAACPHHPYPIKHKLRDCTMMKRFMFSNKPADGDELARDLGGKGTGLGEAKVRPSLADHDPSLGTLCGWPGLGPLHITVGTLVVLP
jgi:hypothetical protein